MSRYPTFAALIRDLVDTHHGGDVRLFAESIGVAPSGVYHWLTGFTRAPSLSSLDALCTVYRLDRDYVWQLLKPKRPAGAGSAALPFPASGRRSTSDKKRYLVRPSRGKSLQNRRIMSGYQGLMFLRGCTPIGELPLAA